MAGIQLSSVILTDRWPGVPVQGLGIPTDGWANTRDNYKTTSANDRPAYPLGTKIAAYSDNSWAPGWYTMMYLQYHSYESGALYDVSNDFSDGQFWCTHADGSTAQAYDTIADNSTIPYYVVSKCITTVGSDVSHIGAVAVPCCSMSSDGTACITQGGYGDSYGWFWVGGVCPAKDITIFDEDSAGLGSTCAGIGACVSGDFATHAKGPIYLEYSAALSTVMMTCDPTDVGDVTDLFNTGYYTEIGWICGTAV